MSLIYRAIWQENRTSLFSDAPRTGLDWLNRKGLRLDALPDNDEVQGEWTDPRFSTSAGYRVSSHRASAEGVDAYRLSLEEDRYNAGQLWTTTLTIISESDQSPTVWVDVERQSEDPFAFVPFRSPVLVRTLISEGDDPRVGHVRLEGRPVIIPVSGLAGLIKNESRRLPIAVRRGLL